jgi:hypothetical protein
VRNSAFIATLTLASCQMYQFEPVEPVTVVVSEQTFPLSPVLKPNVMLAVDRSGSMRQQLDASCTTNCATRMSDLKQAVATFAMLAEDRIRLGLTTFPKEAPLCQPATEVSVPLPVGSRVDDPQASQANRSSATQVNAAVQALEPTGGTPTGATLAFLSTLQELKSADFRDDFVLLLTDGLPNCNAENPNDFFQSPTQCRCQADTCNDALRRLGCLDADRTVAEVNALGRAGVKTIVVGFGSDTNKGDARDVLERMARAGGVARTCTMDSDCGSGDRCASGQCGRWAFQASNRAELEQVLTTVLAGVTPLKCTRLLPEKPLATGAVSLLGADGRPIARGPDTWELTSNNRAITLAPAFCEKSTGETLTLRVAASF